MQPSSAFGMILRFNNGGGFQEVPQLQDITPTSPEPETSDVTTHDTEGGAIIMAKTGRIKHSNVTAVIFFIKGNAVHEAIEDEAYVPSDDPPTWEIEYTDGTVHEFAGVVKGFIRATPQNDQIKATITIEISGPVTRA